VQDIIDGFLIFQREAIAERSELFKQLATRHGTGPALAEKRYVKVR
jgi:hypothetical protein